MDIIQANELQSFSDAINDVCDYADYNTLIDPMQTFLVAVLQYLSNSLDPNIFPLQLDSQQRENWQNYVGGLCQILIAKLKGHFNDDLTGNIITLVREIFNQN
jgi:hypothetical protein